MIYDCFMFYNELELLNIRLNLLGSVVDRFVLVESSVTSRGNKKPFYFEENKHLFSKYADKIIHLKYLPNIENSDFDISNNRFFYENTQRDFLLHGLLQCDANDAILVSDVDEIPNPKKISEFISVPGIKVFEQTMCYYYFNYYSWTNPIWYGTRMCLYKDLLAPGQDLPRNDAYKFTSKGKPTYLRFCEGTHIKDGGWHFSYAGGIDAVLKKKQAIAGGYDYKGEIGREEITKFVKSGRDIHGRKIFFKFLSNSRLPEFLTHNKEKYKNYFYSPKGKDYLLFYIAHFVNISNFYWAKIQRKLKKILALCFHVFNGGKYES